MGAKQFKLIKREKQMTGNTNLINDGLTVLEAPDPLIDFDSLLTNQHTHDNVATALFSTRISF